MRPADTQAIADLIIDGKANIWHVSEGGKIVYKVDLMGIGSVVQCDTCRLWWPTGKLSAEDISKLFVTGPPPTKLTDFVRKVYFDEENHCLATRPMTVEELREIRRSEGILDDITVC